MLTLFKGELSLKEFMWDMPYKDMIALRDARVEQLLNEKKESERAAEERQREAIRNNILAK
jgi:hypothetical protein